ncbi:MULTISPECIES: DUF805 domain-containing protein [Acinetobacter]|uniref:Uncharacterized protein n=1 Tax=Acinetobacter higginsii TaxID=70347 RepID=N8WEA9_9GAMM|nr:MULTISPECIES: DUF805 domain-containing protein [Acinetobacter]ENV10251.1 hypothetical protein F966_01425 [Acinetobacter higginsii]ENX56438.1 hypothetical protein F885_03815 [Acinetobacter higginsii]
MNLSTQSVDHPLSPKGRFGRLSYAAWTFLSSIIAMIIIVIIGFSSGILNGQNAEIPDFPLAAMIIFGIIYIIFLYLSFVFIIRRLHDRNLSGWLSLLYIVPFLNILFMIYLFCVKGTEATNNFGPVRTTAGWEKILGWIYILLIVASLVIAIVTVIAIPSNQEITLEKQQTQIEQQISQA